MPSPKSSLQPGLRANWRQFSLLVLIVSNLLLVSPLMDYRNLFPGFSLAHLQGLQNQTIIGDDYSITLCEGASIIVTR